MNERAMRRYRTGIGASHSRVPTRRRDNGERIALARPTAAIGGGLAAGVLYGTGNVMARARAWTSLGDVPLDIAERELQLTQSVARP